MRKSFVAGAFAVVAVFAGVVYFAREPALVTPPADATAKAAAAAPKAQPAEIPGQRAPVSRSTPPPSRPKPADPRLAKLMSTPGNPQIEYFSDPEGRVIKEVDNDPNSAGFRRPLREYSYAGNQVIRLVSYQYLGTQVQVTTADVTYKPDGSVDQVHESTRYDHGNKAGG